MTEDGTKISLEEIERLEAEILGADPNATPKVETIDTPLQESPKSKGVRIQPAPIVIETTELGGGDVEFGEKEDEPDKSKGGRPRGRPSKKAALIDKYKQLAQAGGYTIESLRDLRRMKISLLEQKLGELVEKTAREQLLNQIPIEEGDVPQEGEDAPDESAPRKSAMSKHREQVAVAALFNMNRMAVMLAEKVSTQYEEKTGVSLDGWTKEIDDEKEQLKQILAAIYDEYKDEISDYVSPLSVWALFMVQSGASVAHSNYQKKKTQSS